MPAEYPDEFKQRIIRRYEKGESIKNLSQELNIAQSTTGARYTAQSKLHNTHIPQRSLMQFQGN